jgi:hypothetical protein
MTSSIWKNILFLFILSGFSQSLAASTPTKLIIRPSVCMVNKLGDTCEMAVKVLWQHDKPIDTCLFQNDLRLACWQNVREINTELVVSLDQDMKFILKNDQQTFASQQIKINTALPKKYRRRLRANWSFF